MFPDGLADVKRVPPSLLTRRRPRGGLGVPGALGSGVAALELKSQSRSRDGKRGVGNGRELRRSSNGPKAVPEAWLLGTAPATCLWSELLTVTSTSVIPPCFYCISRWAGGVLLLFVTHLPTLASDCFKSSSRTFCESEPPVQQLRGGNKPRPFYFCPQRPAWERQRWSCFLLPPPAALWASLAALKLGCACSGGFSEVV